ncbi:selenocysteine lyase [Aliidiomarina minuta]|uniref:Selenocysteine lyase n=1 Tax=Aliidiomarina minuta TaxID=880057 RepID=A0A432WAG8_9GAMM|nr:aminotransferase class V-fold PLP-dependent enzyme [Aliidiomarina minuta]RUO27143.1 selenocysteine lyase [Aliidiomarina minuta]
MYKKHYQRFLSARPGILHCSPHSHYYWPDVTREAQLEYWDDSARLADDKWERIFEEKVPAVQRLIAQRLNVSNPQQIVFAPNTHELVYRVLSSFDPSKTLRILTTDGEFHSFNRQSRRLEERGNVEVTRIATEPFATLPQRWRDAVAAQAYDVIFISQVFFNSGVPSPDPQGWLDAVQDQDTVIMIDGYHGFGAVPTDLGPYQDRVFYLAGAYKYGQSGEGACFALVPPGNKLRPEFTGWFADFESLAKPQEGPVGYAQDGFRFAGSTMDFTALYRLHAVLDWWQRDGLSDHKVHSYIQSLQKAFLQHIDSLNHIDICRQNLLCQDLNEHGHFFTFRLQSAERVQQLAAQLKEQGVATDYRYDRLRFGFALYHEAADYQQIRFA